MNVKIRDAIEQDLPSMLAIYNHAIVNLPATFDLEKQNLEERKGWFQQFGDYYPLIVAELDGRIAGYCCLSAFRTKPAYSRTAELSVYLDPEFHGQGIGSLLMAEILHIAKARDFHVIVAGITGGNETSVKLHDKFGFEFVGCFKEVGYKFNAWQDVWFYQKIIK